METQPQVSRLHPEACDIVIFKSSFANPPNRCASPQGQNPDTAAPSRPPLSPGEWAEAEQDALCLLPSARTLQTPVHVGFLPCLSRRCAFHRGVAV